MATTTSELLPQLQALFATIPKGVNPFSAYATALWKTSYPGVIGWSKPLFILVAVLASLNLIASLVTLVARYRQEGLAIYKLREHRSGGRYITPNTTNVFLFFHVLTCMVWITYPILHITIYDQPGHAYMDLCWATLMWLAPYIGLLETSVGVCYGILVAPSPLARSGSDGHMQSSKPPLSWLPCWLLNSFIFCAPVALIVTVSVPAGLLIKVTRELEEYGMLIWALLQKDAQLFATTGVPAADQVALLQSLQHAKQLNDEAAWRWTPVFTIWCIFVGMAAVLGAISFLAIRSVTKSRVAMARQQSIESIDDSGVFDLDSPRKSVFNARAGQALRQARFEHWYLCFQFGGACVLLFVCLGVLLFDVIRGWEVHTDATMLAVALLIIMLAYYAQSTPSLALLLYRTMRSQDIAGNVVAPQSSPRSVRTARTGEEADYTLADAKKVLFPSAPKHDAGTVLVNGLEKHSFPVSPSVVHQIQIQQVVHTEADHASLNEKSEQNSEYDSHRSSPTMGSSAPLTGAEKTSFEQSYGRAL